MNILNWILFEPIWKQWLSLKYKQTLVAGHLPNYVRKLDVMFHINLQFCVWSNPNCLGGLNNSGIEVDYEREITQKIKFEKLLHK